MLSDHQRAVLADIVVDPDAWAAHVLDEFGPEAGMAHLEAKVARAAPVYEAARRTLGSAYRTRAERTALPGGP
ncbi:hypothetical protein [Azospirillum lipoferum]|uniref:Uncharacterized protein n=1 Tax=Azospirillum lipoferum (strain 4B) TaxID=862719 RepID=G7ZIX1_AZOL4|nr:hypothetical protein [Azospirillum lipoferum]CBS91454.1 protein of unknown function [Azospirillum lipoferum 4B]